MPNKVRLSNCSLYNYNGIVIGCDSSYVSSTHLDPGQKSPIKSYTASHPTDSVDFRIVQTPPIFPELRAFYNY
jgi:hypothetical protein